MGWSFRKRVTIAPGIRLNFSKSGISTTIGPRGASINISKRGIYGNVSIPGTGLYKREKLSGSTRKTKTSNVANINTVSTPPPQYISISSLLKYREVIEPETLTQLQSFMDKGETHVYVERGVLTELKRLSDAKRGVVSENPSSEHSDEPTTAEAVLGVLSLVFGIIIGCVAHFKFDVAAFPTALISVAPLALALIISKYNSR